MLLDRILNVSRLTLFVLHFAGKPILTYEPSVKDQTLKASHSLVISVNIQATPTATVKWFHGDKELYKGNGVNIETEDTFSRLTIKGVRGKQSGTYKIVAENKVGKAEDDFNVTVKGRSRGSILGTCFWIPRLL